MMANSDGIFEIREYLDDSGKIVDNSLVDITKEMDIISKLCGGPNNEESSTIADTNEDESLIRELAMINSSIDAKENVTAHTNQTSSGDIAVDTIIEEIEKKECLDVRQLTSKSSSKSNKSQSKGTGWAKGFFGKTSKDPASTNRIDTKSRGKREVTVSFSPNQTDCHSDNIETNTASPDIISKSQLPTPQSIAHRPVAFSGEIVEKHYG